MQIHEIGLIAAMIISVLLGGYGPATVSNKEVSAERRCSC